MKKVYLFYIRGDRVEGISDMLSVKDNIDVIDGLEYALYAFTDSKKYKKKFLELRDPDIFYIKTLYMDKPEFAMFSESYSDCELDIRRFKTKTMTNGIYHRTDIDVVCTNIEYEYVTDYQDESFYGYLGDLIDCIIVEDDINYAILYLINDKLSYYLNEILLLNDILPKVYPYEEYPVETVIIDEFALFLKLYSNTLRKDL